VDESRVIHTYAGGGSSAPETPQDGVPAVEARLSRPCDIAFDSQGNLYIADTFNHAVRRVDAVTGIITTVAGTIGQFGDSGEGGDPRQALLNRPYGVAFDAADNLYICDTNNHKIKVVRK
jgi:DNA-binding beta-propeller fold protein YncE